MDVVRRDDEHPSEVLEGVELAQLAGGERMSVQYFDIEPDAVVGDHSHEHEQAGYLIGGTLVFTVEGEEHSVEADDSYVIPVEAVHAAENPGDEPTVGIELFSPPRPNPPWTED